MSATTSTDSRSALLTRMGTSLGTGPIVIGESHDGLAAREAIVWLIVNKHITHLSMEGPIVPAALTTATPISSNRAFSAGRLDPTRTEDYLRGALLMDNANYTFSKLLTIAQKYGVPVYFHDLPMRKNNFSGVDPASYNAEVAAVKPNTVRTVRDSMQEKILGGRNDFAARFLRQKFGANVGSMRGLAILVGADHTNPVGYCCNGQELTMQGRLGIPDERVFNFEAR